MTLLFESQPEMYHRQVPIKRQPITKTPKMNEEQLKQRKKKMDALDEIRNSVAPLLQRIDEAEGAIEGKEYLYLQDQLERCHIALDNVEADGDDEVRKERKAIAVFVSNVLIKLDEKSNMMSKWDKTMECEDLKPNDDAKSVEPENDDSVSGNDGNDERMSANDGDAENKIAKQSDESEPNKDVEIKIQHLTNESNSENELTNNESDSTPCQTEVTTNNGKDDSEAIEDETRHSAKDDSEANEDKTSHSAKEAILDNSRIRMQVSDNAVNLVVDVRDLANDDLRVRFEEDELVVSGRKGDQTVVMRKTVPGDCLFSRAVSQLSSDGYMFVKAPRRRYVHPFHQFRRHPFWF